MDKEQQYIYRRIWKARIESLIFYFFRIFPIQRKKIVFCCIEGTTGYTCNPKYIAEELLRRDEKYKMIWLVNDVSKKFPVGVKKVHNSLWNRAYHLSTAHFWIDNSRKQLEVRKRRGQIYIQTWHAKLGFKPTCLDRGASFSKIAYLISKHDSEMIDYVLSNSKWYEDTLPTGMLYNGLVLRYGSPRCDILLNRRHEIKEKIRRDYKLPYEGKILMYAPTFRGGSQGINRTIFAEYDSVNYDKLIEALEERFGGKWYIFLRLHPQLVARKLHQEVKEGHLIDVSNVDDMYEILAGCDAFLTDYSSAAFDAAVMKIPVFICAEDYEKYERERGKLLWDMENLPFPFALNAEELNLKIKTFDSSLYLEKLEELFRKTEMIEDGRASERVAKFMEECGR